MTVINYSTVQSRFHWLWWPTVLAAGLLAHFLVSVAIWLLCFVGDLRNPRTRPFFLQTLILSLPAFVLCGISALLVVLALRGHPVARRGVLLLFVATLAFFWTDIHFHRYQIDVFGSKAYWDSGYSEHIYFTWWWYNDRWFH